ncbi:hypothetical protein [Streptomyces sp. NPDC058092]
MKHLRTVDDVMTHALISVDRGAPFKEIRAPFKEPDTEVPA